MKKNTKIKNFGRLRIFEKNSKKAQQKKLVNILLITIAVVIIVMILMGIFPQFRTQVKSITKPVTDLFTFGQPDSKDFEMTLPHNIELTFDKLASKLKQGAKFSSNRCLIEIEEFKDFENDCRIILHSLEEDKKMAMEIECPDEYGVPRTLKTLPKEDRPELFPCVVAGKPAIDNFYNYWIEGKKERIEIPESTAYASEVWITDRYTVQVGKSKYDIEDEELKNEKGEEITYLYKAEHNRICFITTYNGDILGICDYDNSGLDDDCIEDLNSKYKIPICKES